MARPLLSVLSMLACLCVAASATAAPPPVPANVPYQGVLLDDQGQPQTGSVDLSFRVYDSILAGTLLYKEEILGVPLVDGVFTVELGPTGNPTDTPVDPLTTDLVLALAGDLPGTGPGRFISVQVGSATPGARNPILTVPYALRAESAESADSATVATSTLTVDGLDASIVSVLVEQWNQDGGPLGGDPSEGTADTDGDGIPNFADPDNDDDGISDGDETSAGTDINLVTPTISGIDPATLTTLGPTPVVVTGTNFDPAMSADVGGTSLTLSNVLATSFDTTIPQLPPGLVDLNVTLANGETATLPDVEVQPPTPAAPIPTGLPFTTASQSRPINLAFRSNGLAVASVSGTLARDETLNGSVDFPLTTTTVPGTGPGRRAVDVDDGDRVAALRCTASACDIDIVFDDDGDGIPGQGGEQLIPIETVGGASATMEAPALGFDGLGRAAAGYLRRNAATAAAVLAHDLDDDEVFQSSEVVVIESLGLGATQNLSAIAFDTANRAHFAYVVSNQLQLAADLNGDGDTADPGELETVAAFASSTSCVGLAIDSSDNLAIVWGDPATGDVELRWDGNGDRDFDDVGEQFNFPTSFNCAIAALPTGGIALARQEVGNEIWLDADRNGDRDFDELGERVLVGAPVSSALNLSIGIDPAGDIYVLGRDGVYVDVVP